MTSVLPIKKQSIQFNIHQKLLLETITTRIFILLKNINIIKLFIGKMFSKMTSVSKNVQYKRISHN